MTARAIKLLQKARLSPKGWNVEKLHTLYTSFGFVWKNRRRRAPHRVYSHPEYPTLWQTVAHGRKIDVKYIEDAVELIDRLIRLKASEKE
jgi:hypothetical protein